MNGPIQILLVVTHPIVRRGLASILVARNGMQVVGEASDVAEAVVKACLLRPDVVLVDLNSPNIEVIETISAIRTYEPKAAIVVLTGFDEQEQSSQVAQSGVIRYLRKDTSPDELFNAIRCVANYDTYHSQEIVDTLLLSKFSKTTVRGKGRKFVGKRGVKIHTRVARVGTQFSAQIGLDAGHLPVSEVTVEVYSHLEF